MTETRVSKLMALLCALLLAGLIIAIAGLVRGWRRPWLEYVGEGGGAAAIDITRVGHPTQTIGGLDGPVVSAVFGDNIMVKSPFGNFSGAMYGCCKADDAAAVHHTFTEK